MDATDRSLSAAFDRITWRARLLAGAEAAAWGAAAGAISIAAGAVVAAALGVWKGRRTTRSAVVRAVDRAAGAHNVLVTADEVLDGRLPTSADVRDRVLTAASVAMESVRPSGAVRSASVWTALLVALVSWTLAAIVSTARVAVPRGVAPAGGRTRSSTTPPPALHVFVRIDPPPYTGLSPLSIRDPAEVRLVEGSFVEIASEPGVPATVVHDGTIGARFEARRTGYAVVRSDNRQRVVPIVVVPDALPVVRLTAPARDLVFANPSPRLDFAAQADDDFGVASLSLQYTKVSGSGEEYQFSDGVIPLTIVRRGARQWTGTASRSLAELGIGDGDMLVYRAVATDAKPGARQASSDAYFVEISRLGVAAGDAFTLPQEETRYALSEQMLILKTERLARQHASLAAAALSEASMNLAVEQRMIRAEFVFMLGGEIEDEEVEAEQSVELQAGRLANRGQRDLRDATRAMSQAETLLAGSDPAAAVAAERAAVAALQRAFARDRYLLRALASRTRLDPSRRLTGARGDAREVRFAMPRAPENRRAALLQDLLAGAGAIARERTGVDERARLQVLAETALRIDPDSPALRRISTALQGAADTWTRQPTADRDRTLDAISADIAAACRSSLADPPVPLRTVAPGLQRALDGERARPR